LINNFDESNSPVKKKKRINSCAKGKNGERAWRDKLRDGGFEARRGQKFSGSKDSPDVVCPGLPSIHFEVKYQKTFSSTDMYDAVAQATRDAGDYKLPTVAFRKNNHDWLVIMTGNDWLNLIKETDRVVSVFCPDCKGHEVRKEGIAYNGKQQYSCKAEACSRNFRI